MEKKKLKKIHIFNSSFNRLNALFDNLLRRNLHFALLDRLCTIYISAALAINALLKTAISCSSLCKPTEEAAKEQATIPSSQQGQTKTLTSRASEASCGIPQLRPVGCSMKVSPTLPPPSTHHPLIVKHSPTTTAATISTSEAKIQVL